MGLDLKISTVPERYIVSAAHRCGFVYVLLADRFVKVGYANSVAERMKAIQTSSPYELVLVGATPASISEEKLLHRQLWRWHVRGEWYRGDPDLFAHLADRGIPLDAEVLRVAGW